MFRCLRLALVVAVAALVSATHAAVRWSAVLDQPETWYASAEARAIAANMLAYQSPEGGWPTDTDTSLPPPPDRPKVLAPTIDDNATTLPLGLFARVVTATGDTTLRAAFERGFDYLLAAQYPNGGWPQYFPLRKGYYSHITYNDNAMISVLALLRDASQGKEPFGFVDEARRVRAAAAVAKGLGCILRTQVKQDGKLTAWGAQHDVNTLAPAWGRKFEPPSIVSAESVGIVKFLLAIPDPSPEIISAIEAAVAWLDQVKLTGLREDHPPRPDVAHKHDRVLVPDPAAPPLWARFYELGTNRPLYGSRDGIAHYVLAEVEPERRGGYAWHNDDPQKLIQRDYPRWRKKHPLPDPGPKPDAIVAADGSGQYTSLQDAISAAPMRTAPDAPRWVILVKPGTYRERVYVQRERGNITVQGEDAATTIITFGLHANMSGPDGKPIGTFRTPTVQVDGDGMVWENLTIANDAGPVGQALALRVDGDRVIFRRCRFLGWQDTILGNRGRHYFTDCYIEGSVDFIFGAATAYFDRCHIHCLRHGYITAASTPQGTAHGFVFADCQITGAAGVKSYLGRPWRNFARTVFLRTEMADVVRPEGWHNWSKPDAEKTVFYAEFANTGPGSDLAARVPWLKLPGTGESAQFSPASVLASTDGWNPAGRPVLHLAGDSTMADKPETDYPERGWGQLFREFVRPPLLLVNHTANGRSTLSFRTLGHWQRLLDQLAAGDWVVIEFGHNDSKQEDPARYADPAKAYPENLRQFVRDVRARGAHPVLATPVVRRHWDDAGALFDTHGAYLEAVRRVAAEEKVPLMDMEAVTRRLLTGLGPAGSLPLFLHFKPGEHPKLPEGKTDNTHFTASGARLVAALAAAEMRRLRLPIAEFLMNPDTAAWVPDLGDGRYRNPVLHADYSDPDAVRVGDDYWMTASSFSHVPGLPLLHSRDLVNWELVGHALPRLVPESAFATPQHGKGVWAPAIRFHAGKYWIYYPDPDFGLYVITATDPLGTWSAPVLVKGGKGLIDPCPLWDDDGKVYLIHAWAKSRAGMNNVLTLLRLDATGTRVEEDLGVIIDGHKLPGYTTLEGPKLYRRDGWYYVFAPAGGVKDGWQSVFRARDIRGPYADRIVLAQGATSVNGPHQGALVDTPAGDWWFLHFQDKAAYGRVVHLQPVFWQDDWPVIGQDPDGDGKGQPVLSHQKPNTGPTLTAVPPTNDEFDGPALSPQWQWQANPAENWFSLTARAGVLRLIAQPEPKPGNLYDAPHLLLQKFPAPEFTVTTTVDIVPQADGDSAGLIIFGYDYAWLGLKQRQGKTVLLYAVCRDASKGAQQDETELALPSAPGSLLLRVSVRAGAVCEFSYSTDGRSFQTVPAVTFTATPGRWVGAKVGLFAAGQPAAHADFAWVRVTPPLSP